MAAIPYAPHVHGYLSMVALEDVVTGIVEVLHKSDLDTAGVRFRNHVRKENISLTDPVKAVFGNDCEERHGAFGKIEYLSPREWAKRSGELGMNESLMKWVSSAEDMREQLLPGIIKECGSVDEKFHSEHIPSTQIAIVDDSDGMPAIVHDTPVPKLRPDTILVKTVAVALNSSDYRMGAAAPSAGAIVGMDFAGQIVAIPKVLGRADLHVGNMVSSIVHGSNPGDHETGSFAHYVLAAADFVLKVPVGMRPQQVATLRTGLLTGCMALWSSLGIPASLENPGKRDMRIPVLVCGGSTSLRILAILLVKQ
jgi:hypothetical protein